MAEALLTVADVASLLRVSRAFVYGARDRIGYVRLGRAIRFHPADVAAFLEASKCHAQGPASTAIPNPRFGMPRGPTRTARPAADPRVAAIMARLVPG